MNKKLSVLLSVLLMVPTIQKINANLKENSKIANVSKKCKTNCSNFQFYKEKAKEYAIFLKDKAGTYADFLLKYSKENKKKTLTGLALAAILVPAAVYACKSKQVGKPADEGKDGSGTKGPTALPDSDPSTVDTQEFKKKEAANDIIIDEFGKSIDYNDFNDCDDYDEDLYDKFFEKPDNDNESTFGRYLAIFQSKIKQILDSYNENKSKENGNNFRQFLFDSVFNKNKETSKDFDYFINFLKLSINMQNFESYKNLTKDKNSDFNKFVELINEDVF